MRLCLLVLPLRVKPSGRNPSFTKNTGEHTSLNAIHSIVPSFCPESYANGPLEDITKGYFLVTDFLDLSPSKWLSLGSGLSLAQKLGKLHSAPAAVPDGYKEAGM